MSFDADGASRNIPSRTETAHERGRVRVSHHLNAWPRARAREGSEGNEIFDRVRRGECIDRCATDVARPSINAAEQRAEAKVVYRRIIDQAGDQVTAVDWAKFRELFDRYGQQAAIKTMIV